MSAIRFETCPPPFALAGAVRELWLLEDEGGFHAGLPKPYAELVISLSGVHWWRATPSAPEHCYVDSWVTPIQRGPRYARSVGRRLLIGARLEPWAALALFRSLPRGDGVAPPRLEQLIGTEAGQLRSALINAGNDADRLLRLSAWLEAQPALRGVGARTIDGQGIGANVSVLATSMRLAPRSLRRRFALDAGVSPKNWLKLHRLDAVLRNPALADVSQSLAEIADAHGYSDQAHFTREVASLTGTTPGMLRRRPTWLPPHLFPGT